MPDWRCLRRTVERYGTPVYLVHETLLADQANRFRNAFLAARAGTECCYSYKTNPLGAIARFLHGLGFGAEVSNGHELGRALRSGVAPERIVFNGPLKTDEELRLALEHGVLVHLDGWDELRRVSALASSAAHPARIGLRLSTGYDGGEIGGRDVKFGFTAGADFLRAVRAVEDEPGLALESFHFHLGTLVAVPDPYLTALRLFDEPLAALREPLNCLDIGGAFGTSHGPAPDSDTVEPAVFAAAIADAVDRRFPSTTRLFVEPGRSVVDGSTTLVSRVVAVKQREHAVVAVLDSGVNLVPSTLYLEHDVSVASAGDGAIGPGEVAVDLFGPLCMSIDRVTRLRLERAPQVGNLVAVEAAGAYDFAESWTFGRGRPPVVWMDADDEIRCVRSPEPPDALDHLERQVT